MISSNVLLKIKNILLEAQNPVFLFDNDPDGICSAAILSINLEKGMFFPLKSINSLGEKEEKEILKINPDFLFVLDKPFFYESFFRKIRENKTKIVLLDHHEVENKRVYDFVFNSFPTSEPTSYIAQKIFNSKKTELLSLIGCLSDNFVPEFYDSFRKDYPELINFNSKSAFDLFYSSQIGKVCRILAYSIKNSNQKIIRILDFLVKIKGPYDILYENEKNYFMHEKFKEIESFIEKTISKIKISKKIVFLEYEGKYSLSSEISNKLSYLYPDKFIIVCYKKSDFCNVSLRGNGAKKFALKIISLIKESTGGGHENASGLRIPFEKFSLFKKFIFDRKDL